MVGVCWGDGDGHGAAEAGDAACFPEWDVSGCSFVFFFFFFFGKDWVEGQEGGGGGRTRP